MRRAEADIDVVDFEVGFDELLQHPFQVRHRDALVDGKTLDLVKHRRVGLVIVGTIHAPRTDNANGRAVGFHAADLHGAGVGAQYGGGAVIARSPLHIKCVHFGPRRVVAGDVKGVEIIPVAFDLRTFGNGEPHVGKDRGHFFRHLTDRMNGALGALAACQCHIKPFAAQTGIKGSIAKGGFLGDQGRVDLVLECIERGAGSLALFGRHLAQLAHLQADLAFFAKGLHAQIFQRGFVLGVGHKGQIFLLQIIHWIMLLAVGVLFRL